MLIVRGDANGTPIKVSKVLLALAGGDDLAPGVRAAVAVARPDATVMVLRVAQAMFGLHGFAYEESGEEIHETMTQACRLLGDDGVVVQGLVAHEGPVAKAVAKVATDWDADIIVIGSSRMGDIGSLFLGSVSHELLHITDRPALIAERVTA